MVEELVDVVIHVKVPKKYAEEFRGKKSKLGLGIWPTRRSSLRT